MKNVTIKEVQLTILDALLEIHNICEKYNIPYWLDSGTLLGAIRNEKFIPWDDDIDICMLREDFNKFLVVASNELDNNKYFLQTSQNDKYYTDYNIPCKLRVNNTELIETNKDYKNHINNKNHKGFFIDILPCDRYPKNRIKRKLLQSIYLFYSAESHFYQKNLTFKKALISRLIHYTGSFLLIKKITNYLIKKINSSSENNIISKGLELPFHKGNIPLNEIFPLKKINFEGKSFYAPKNTNYYLISLYGDNYLTPPNINNRVTHSSSFKKS